MSTFYTVKVSGYYIGVMLYEGDVIEVFNKKYWKSESYSSRFVGDIVGKHGKDITSLSNPDGKYKTALECKILMMYERQPYFKRINHV